MQGVRVRLAFTWLNGQKLPAEVAEFGLDTMIDVLHYVPRNGRRWFLEHVDARRRPGETCVRKDIGSVSPFVVINKLHDVLFSAGAGFEWNHTTAHDECQKIGFRIRNSFNKRAGVYAYSYLKLLDA